MKSEYITSNISYKKLSEKYDVSTYALCRKAQRDGWGKERKEYKKKITEKKVKIVEKKELERYKKILNVSDKLLKKIEKSVEEIEELSDKTLFKSLTGAIKDIKDIQDLKSERDIKEQEIRIKKMEKDIKNETDNNIKVEIVGIAEEYSK
ncbi:MAG: hypothetical protein ACTTIO_04315 [Candidatus Fimenecus sp.]